MFPLVHSEVHKNPSDQHNPDQTDNEKKGQTRPSNLHSGLNSPDDVGLWRAVPLAGGHPYWDQRSIVKRLSPAEWYHHSLAPVVYDSVDYVHKKWHFLVTDIRYSSTQHSALKHSPMRTHHLFMDTVTGTITT